MHSTLIIVRTRIGISIIYKYTVIIVIIIMYLPGQKKKKRLLFRYANVHHRIMNNRIIDFETRAKRCRRRNRRWRTYYLHNTDTAAHYTILYIILNQ